MFHSQSIPMDQAMEALRADPAIRLIDVRGTEEHRAGHIPGSISLPLDRVEEIARFVPDQNTTLFVYCRSGARSRTACGYFAKLGYRNVSNIGGILHYSGPIEREE